MTDAVIVFLPAWRGLTEVGDDFLNSSSVQADAVIVRREPSADHVRIEPIDDREVNLDEDDCVRVDELVSPWRAWAVEFRDIKELRWALSRLLGSSPTAVDNDHGWVGSGKDFLKKLRENPTWDWRIEPQRG